MAEMLPFPLARRRAFVCRHADIAWSYDAEAGERHIQRQVKEQTATLTRKGVSDERVEAEGKALEAALRAEMWRHVMMPGGAA